jgi:sec-independent protein translocase protein TatB
MFNVGGGEIIVILLLALLVLGPDKLPSTAKKVGKFLHEVRRMTSGFEQEVRSAMDFENISSDPVAPSAATPETTISTTEDAIARTTDGPRLSGPAEISGTAPTTPTQVNPFNRSKAPTDSAAFVVDLSGTGSVAEGE